MISTDTLVIGAGSAGLFAALGFAERGRVLLLEAGPDAGSPPPDWGLHAYALPEAHYHRYVDASTAMPVPQGRGLGGGSTVNSAAALRGQPWCYDAWSVPGWSWQDCLPAFCAIERDAQFGARRHHGDHGPIPITRLTPGPLDEALFALWDQAGHGALEDHNAPGALGHGMWPTNRKDGGRWGTWAGVVPLARRAGVEIHCDRTVQRLTFSGLRCTGAEVSGPQGSERIHAERVVLCAGAFGTPSILLRSGIGPETMLTALGVPTRLAHAGVGANLQDHPWCLLEVDTVDAALIEARPVSGNLLRYELDGTASDAAHREAQIFTWQTRPYDRVSPPTRVAMTAALMTPHSRGRFGLTPGGPELRVGLLEDPRDAADMAQIVAAATRDIDRLVEQGLIRVPDDAWWRQIASPTELLDAVRARVGTYNHHCGTCALGAADGSADAVVGPDLAVIGTEGLAIADSSIIPRIPRANTNLAAMMIGHRAGQIVA